MIRNFIIREWENLPEEMRNKEVRKYYDILKSKNNHLILKRIFDLFMALVTLFLLSPIMLVISILIKLDSPGPVFFKQVRVTQYGKKFKIFKFRTMIYTQEKGFQVTVKNDSRVTRVGKYLRKWRLDEFPQLFNIFLGEMTFVGTRPEVVRYVNQYSHEMLATLLLPAGITSEASINYKDEQKLLANTNDVESVYIKKILPQKMKYNLKSIEEFNFFNDLRMMLKTVVAVTKG